MKKILTMAIAAVALLALASCQKENIPETAVESAGTIRIIKGSFSNDGTKTTLGSLMHEILNLWDDFQKVIHFVNDFQIKRSHDIRIITNPII